MCHWTSMASAGSWQLRHMEQHLQWHCMLTCGPRNYMLWFLMWLLLSLGNVSTFARESGVLCDLVTLVSLFLTAAVDSVGLSGKSQLSLEVTSVLLSAPLPCSIPASYHRCF